MNDWGSIFLYGYLGWLVFTDAWMLVVAICYMVGKKDSLIPPPTWWFFGRRLLGVVVGIIAAFLYKEGVVDWMWAMLLACTVSIPIMFHQIWLDLRPKPAVEME